MPHLETTASTLNWVLYYLATHPDVQRRFHEECDAVLQGNFDTPIDELDVANFPYTEKVIRETMRMRYVAPAIGAYSNEPVHLMGYDFPKDTQFFLLTRVAAFRALQTQNPFTFDPDR